MVEDSTADRGTSGDPGPLTEDLLADLHAGLLHPADADRVLAAVQQDPEAQQILASLNDVASVLRSRGADENAEEEIPRSVRIRLDAALSPQQSPVPSVLSMRPSRRSTAILAAAAAAVLVVVGVGLVRGFERSGTPSAPVQASGTPGDSLSPRLVMDTVGKSAPGRFADPEILRECLQANGIEPATRLLGSGPVTIDGQESTLLVVPGPSAPTVTALVVGDSCGPGDAATVSRADIG